MIKLMQLMLNNWKPLNNSLSCPLSYPFWNIPISTMNPPPYNTNVLCSWNHLAKCINPYVWNMLLHVTVTASEPCDGSRQSSSDFKLCACYWNNAMNKTDVKARRNFYNHGWVNIENDKTLIGLRAPGFNQECLIWHQIKTHTKTNTLLCMSLCSCFIWWQKCLFCLAHTRSSDRLI